MQFIVLSKRELVYACCILGSIFIVVFFPVLFGNKSLLTSATTQSVMNSGGYDPTPVYSGVSRTPDPGAPAWTIEPWFKLIADQIWGEHNVPLWNPYSAYGTPLAASMQAQPLFPLFALLSLHVSPRTLNVFLVARPFVAGLLMFCFARLFLGFSASIFSAITFMMTGYFIMLINMPHLSVEILAPGILLALEILLRRNSWAAVSGVAATIFLCSVGGMPESLFLILAFGTVYFFFRLLFEYRKHVYPRIGKFAASIIMGFSLSALLLLPFGELTQISHDTHQTSNLGGDKIGLHHMADYRLLAMYFFPLIFGPVVNSIFVNFAGWTGSWSYWGIVPSFFATAAVLFWFFPRKVLQPPPLRQLTAFFSIMLFLMVLKRFGHPMINWVGRLPLSEMVVFFKYLEPLMALCVAMLAGIGFSALAAKHAKLSYFLVTAVAFLGGTLSLALWSLPRVLANPQFSAFYYLSIMAGVIFLVVGMVMIAWLAVSSPSRIYPWIVRSFVGLLCLELSVNFIVPCFYVLNSLPSIRRNPYAGAPYIDFIRARNGDHSRVFARENFLFPNWSAAFKLADVRDLDALYYNRYRIFMRSFLLPPGDEARRGGDLADRFTGGEFPYRFESDVEKRFLVLSSIKYLISASEYDLLPKVYDKEVRVYEFAPTLPRASLFRSVEVLPDSEVLARLKDPAFNPSEKVILSRESLAGVDPAIVQSLTETPAGPPSAASISRYESQHVWIDAETKEPAILMLNDANYPGWRVYVNGNPATMVTSDYLFRGVFLPAGSSRVEFVYQPNSFRIGVLISLAALVALIAITLVERRRRITIAPFRSTLQTES